MDRVRESRIETPWLEDGPANELPLSLLFKAERDLPLRLAIGSETGAGTLNEVVRVAENSSEFSFDRLGLKGGDQVVVPSVVSVSTTSQGIETSSDLFVLQDGRHLVQSKGSAGLGKAGCVVNDRCRDRGVSQGLNGFSDPGSEHE